MRPESLTLRVEQDGAAVVVRASGEIDMATAPLLSQRLDETMSAAPAPGAVIVDLTGVQFLASAGLSVLVRQHGKGAELGVDLLVVAPDGPARRAMEITALDNTLQLYDNLDEAVAKAGS